MVKKCIAMTRKEASELFLILSAARFKLNGKAQTAAQKYWEKFEEALDLKLEKD